MGGRLTLTIQNINNGLVSEASYSEKIEQISKRNGTTIEIKDYVKEHPQHQSSPTMYNQLYSYTFFHRSILRL